MYHSHSVAQTFALWFIASLVTAQAFVNTIDIQAPTRHSTTIPKTSLYFKLPWKVSDFIKAPPKSKSDVHLEELQRAARDPKTFEAYVLKKNGAENAEYESEEVPDDDYESPSESPSLPKYVPIEQWDAERKKDDLSWEERVQFDGQRSGNRFKQNEILRSNINRF
jgi:hypothetical protein